VADCCACCAPDCCCLCHRWVDHTDVYHSSDPDVSSGIPRGWYKDIDIGDGETVTLGPFNTMAAARAALRAAEVEP
jgi:hypothetical protein